MRVFHRFTFSESRRRATTVLLQIYPSGLVGIKGERSMTDKSGRITFDGEEKVLAEKIIAAIRGCDPKIVPTVLGKLSRVPWTIEGPMLR